MDLSISNTSTAKIKIEPSSDDEEDPIGENVVTELPNVEKERVEFAGVHIPPNLDPIASNSQIIKSEPEESDEASAATTHIELEIDMSDIQKETLKHSVSAGNEISCLFAPMNFKTMIPV